MAKVIKIEREDGGVDIVTERVRELDTFFSDSPNLVDKLPKDELVKITDRVITDYDNDLASRASWEMRRGNWYKLFAVQRDPKNFPWKDCSNVGIPTISIAATQFQARAFEALFVQKDLVRAKWRDGSAKDAALRVSKHMSYQLTEEMEEWEEDMDTLLMQLAINGSAFKKTYYDRILKRPVSRYIGVNDFIAPAGARRLEDAPRLTHRLRYTRDEILLRGEKGEFILSSPPSDMPWGEMQQDPTIDQAKEDVNGIIASPMERDSRLILLEQHCNIDLDGDGIGEPYIVTVNYHDRTVYRIESRRYKDDRGEEKVFDCFTHYIFLPNPEGLYGFGFGHLLEGLNEAINSITNQLIDAGTLNNTSGGLFNRRSGLQGGDIELSMGQFKGVDVSSDDLRKAIFQFDFKPPSTVLLSLLGLLQDYSRQISTVSEQMLGKLPPSDTTATSMMAVLEQGLKVFSTIQRRIHRSLRKELKKIYIINSVTLDEEVYFQVQDSDAEEYKTLGVGKEDYLKVYDVVPAADPNITSKTERFMKAKQAWDFGMQNPLISQNPDALYALSIEFLSSLEIEGAGKILQKPQPQTPPDIPPHEENAGFLSDKMATILPEQDHIGHFEIHKTFSLSDWRDKLTAQGKNLLEQHMRETLSALYMKGQQNGQDGAGGAMGAMEAGGANFPTPQGNGQPPYGNEDEMLSMLSGGLPPDEGQGGGF